MLSMSSGQPEPASQPGSWPASQSQRPVSQLSSQPAVASTTDKRKTGHTRPASQPGQPRPTRQATSQPCEAKPTGNPEQPACAAQSARCSALDITTLSRAGVKIRILNDGSCLLQCFESEQLIPDWYTSTQTRRWDLPLATPWIPQTYPRLV